MDKLVKRILDVICSEIVQGLPVSVPPRIDSMTPEEQNSYKESARATLFERAFVGETNRLALFLRESLTIAGNEKLFDEHAKEIKRDVLQGALLYHRMLLQNLNSLIPRQKATKNPKA